MKQLNIYFGKQQDGVLGFSTADIIKCEVSDDFNPQQLFSEEWVSFSLSNGAKYINTKNVLWFDLIEKTEDKGE